MGNFISSLFQAVNWKLILPTIALSITIPMDMVLRFFLPIISGIVWVFLKPIVEKWRKDIKKEKTKDNGHTDY
ncbi:hypothetical protein [Flagellimonas eckloniae]|uniref:Uncharacterized protein n=1 Tax=Flagellimonas eckloniae TaxID=346185 RepID=A0A0Q1BHZ8_9FLAO|nr:hypothetical protein [Allomuricauda eckloniae]KQC30166.1 hypothetical protein AAY42_09970 [Allomuricauda eckloniae]